MRRSAAILVTLTFLLASACSPSDSGSTATPTDGPTSGGGFPGVVGDKADKGIGTVSASNVTYAPGVQVIDRPDAFVVWEVDADGSGYTLDGDIPGVDKLAVGTVMLIKNEAVGRIRELTRRGDRVHVRVDPVGIADVIGDGELTWSGANADLAHVSVLAWDDPKGVTPNSSGGNAPASSTGWAGQDYRPRLTPASYVPVRGSAREENLAEVRVGEYTVRVRCDVVGAGSMKLVLEASRNIGKAQIVATATMTLNRLTSSGSVEVDGGTLTAGRFATDVQGTLDLDIKAVKADPGIFAFNEIVNVPIQAYWPVYISGIPFTVAVTAKILIAPAVSSGGTNLALGASFSFGGAGTTTVKDKATSGEGTLSVSNKTSIDNISGVSLGASGFVVAVRPRFGFGLGTGAVGSTAFTDFVASVGVTNGSALGIVACKQLTVVLTPRVGVEGRLFGASTEFVKPLGETKVTDYVPKVPVCKL